MHVLHVMEATIGGTRRHLVDVAGGQRELGLEVTVVASTLRDPGFPADLDALESLGVRVIRLPMVREIAPRADWGHLRELSRILRESSPDVVHTHSSKAGVLGRRASIQTGVGARVHTPHTFAFLFDALFSRSKRALFRAIERRLARRTDRLIAVSASEAETFRRSRVVDPGKVRVVPNGIDPARMEGAAPLDLTSVGLDPARPTAALVGLVYPAKGQDLALDALVLQGMQDLQLLVVGPGETDGLAEQARRLGVEERVAITGPRDDVPAVLAAADLLLLPSRWEGMPYVVLEAMAASRVVVTTPVDGARDLVEDEVTGFVAEEVEAHAIAAALARALESGPERRASMAAVARARLDAEHTVGHMVERLRTVYAEALENGRSSGR